MLGENYIPGLPRDIWRKFKRRQRNESPDNESSSGDSISMPTVPNVGSKWSHAPEWPEATDKPVGTIEVTLYYHENTVGGIETCRRVKPYVEYGLLEAFGDTYAVDVSIHDAAVPEGTEDRLGFADYYRDCEDYAKDANMLLYDFDEEDGTYGLAGHDGGWATDTYFAGWNRNPDDPITNVGEGNDGWAEGVGIVLHEIGHCLGYSHHGERNSHYGYEWVSPMSTGYGNSDANRYSFEYCDEVTSRAPLVE